MLSVAALKHRGSFILDAAFDLPTPGVVALFGRSGCGKSTLIDVIAGLLELDTGRVAIDGIVVLDTARRLRMPPEQRRIGYVFQDARLFPHLRVAGNLRYAAKRAVGRHFITMDAVVGLLHLDSLMERRIHQLSGGECQRVAIGRALLSQPRLLLLDEPLAGLDGAQREEVLPYLEKLRDQLAIPMVYVTHHFEEVLRLATHLVLMEAGSVTAQGEIGAMSLHPHLRAIIGRESVGAILDGTVLGMDEATHLVRVRVGHGEINVPSKDLSTGTALRVQILARDIIVSTRPPQHLSVRNSLAGTITHVQDDGIESDLVTIDIGAAHILARITKAATRELGLRPGMHTWALIKSVSLRGYRLHAPPADEVNARAAAPILSGFAPTLSGSPDA